MSFFYRYSFINATMFVYKLNNALIQKKIFNSNFLNKLIKILNSNNIHNILSWFLRPCDFQIFVFSLMFQQHFKIKLQCKNDWIIGQIIRKNSVIEVFFFVIYECIPTLIVYKIIHFQKKGSRTFNSMWRETYQPIHQVR